MSKKEDGQGAIRGRASAGTTPAQIVIRRGLDLPIAGAPRQEIEDAAAVRSVAVIGADYHGLKPTMAVQVGDKVKTGQPLFADKTRPGVNITAPASGTVSAINRGERRVLQSVVIDVDAAPDAEDALEFDRYDDAQIAALDAQQVRTNLLRSGLWTALRTRPFSRVPAADADAEAIFVSAMDTHPLAADPAVVLREYAEDFKRGLFALSRLAPVHLCRAGGASIPGDNLPCVQMTRFKGPHPAGLVGTHIHFLHPVNAQHTVWHIGYQDVIAVGKLMATGRLWTQRIVALGGPVVKQPRLLRTRLGANLQELTAGGLEGEGNRIVSGSVLGGRTAAGPYAYLGRYHVQVSCLQEGTKRELLAFMRLGANKHSVTRAFLSSLLAFRNGPSEMDMTTSTQGSPRAMVPIGNYEAVMPLDILPTQLLRALIVGDTETAQNLGCLELDEEDLALCTYVCAGKYEYGPILRDNLTRIEKEG